MELLTERYANQIRGTNRCFDRIVVQGLLEPISYAKGMTCYFYSHDLRIFDFTEWAKPLRDLVRDNAHQVAAEAGVPLVYIRKMKGKKKVRQEDLVKECLNQRGDRDGLVCVLAAMERCTTFRPWYDDQQKYAYFLRKEGFCLHYYFYFQDAELGLCYVRVPTWAPFRLQVYWNGHNWLAQKLKQEKIGFQQHDNAFTDIEDFERAQKIADKLRVQHIYRKLGELAQRCCPVGKRLGMKYSWSTQQAEYATDIIFERQADLQAFYGQLTRQLVEVVKPNHIATFLGKQIHGKCQAEIGNRYDVRLEGTRIRHFMGPASIKMYDKYGHVLRIETTTNDVSFFPQYREVRPLGGRRKRAYFRWTKMKKSLWSLPDLAQVMNRANQRYLEFISALDMKPYQVGAANLRRVSQTVTEGGRGYRGLNFFSAQDQQLLQAILEGEFHISGFRNQSLRHYLPKLSSAQISRLLKRLRVHGLIKKVHRSYKYYLTTLGMQVITTGLKLKELFIVPQLAPAA